MRGLISLVALVLMPLLPPCHPAIIESGSIQTNPRSPDDGIIKQAGQKKLEGILQKMAAYCDVLEEVAIYYYCQERVEEIIYPIPPRYRGFITTDIGLQGDFSRFHNKKFIRNEFIYDYQLIRKGKRKRGKETRTLLKENNREKRKKGAKLKTKLFEYRTIVYGPLVFAQKQQKYYNFKIIDSLEWQGRNILVIEATPRPRVQKKLTWGKFWVDEKKFTILKINISQKSMGNYEEIEKKSRVLNASPQITIFLHYDIEKNGIRFPSKVVLEEVYITAERERILLSKINVDYTDYRFFTVGVQVREKPKKTQ
jgi:hypothetical protein